jgi:hypothetical protein
VRFDDNR